jgi:predicted nucleic acid-binding protein
VTERRWRGPAVVDTDVYSAALVPGSQLAARYEPLILGRSVFISFQTAAEIHFGALLRGWGQARLLQLEARLAATEIVHSGPDLVVVHAQLRVDCRRAGHPLAHKIHDGDRWIAATAIRLGLPLVSNDAIFEDVPGLLVETLRAR